MIQKYNTATWQEQNYSKKETEALAWLSGNTYILTHTHTHTNIQTQ